MEKLIKTIQLATIALYSGNILAAKIQSAKSDYERNEIIKESEKVLKEMKELMGMDVAEGLMELNKQLQTKIADIFRDVQYGRITFFLSPEKKTLDYSIEITGKLPIRQDEQSSKIKEKTA